MSLEGLILEKLRNFVTRFEGEFKQLDKCLLEEELALAAKEEREPEHAKRIQFWSLKDLVVTAILFQPYWQFIEEGQFEALVEMASLTRTPSAELAVQLYSNLTEGRRDQLHKYLVFFLHGVQDLIKNGGAP